MTWWKSTGIPAERMADVTAPFDAARLAQEIAPAFLVSILAARRLIVRPGATSEGLRPAGVPAEGNLDEDVDVDGGTADLLLRFLPVRRRASSDNPFVGVGRLDGNDICLPDSTVSRFHAFFVENGGSFSLMDAGSANGTFVERTRAPTRGAALAPLALRSGDSIRFGSVTTTFLTAADVLIFVKDNLVVDRRSQ